jgi:hypothetical protein
MSKMEKLETEYNHEYMNNFHCYFPNGFYRSQPEFLEAKKRKIKVLDELLEVMPLDLELFKKKKKETFFKGWDEIFVMIRPFYVAMRMLGFSQEELTT